MSEAVAVQSLMMMTSIVSEESLADRHTYTQTQGSSTFNICKVAYDFENTNGKKEEDEQKKHYLKRNPEKEEERRQMTRTGKKIT